MKTAHYAGRTVAAAALLGLVAHTGVSGAEPLPMPRADDWVPSQITPTTITLNWSHATMDDRVPLDPFGRRPVVDADKRVWLLACERDIQLDCVESVGLVDDTGNYSAGTFVAGHTMDVTTRPGIRPYSEHHLIWSLPGLELNGREARLELALGMGGIEGHGFPGLNMGINFYDAALTKAGPGDPFGCRFIDQGQCFNPPTFPEGTTLRIVLRLSWLSPSAIAVRGTGVSAEIEALGTGAHLITITGHPMLLQSQGGQAEIESGRPQWVTSSFDFGMYDPRVGSAPGGDCTVNDPLVLASNAQGTGIPTWNASRGRLDLRMSAPHYWADGITPWRGYYETSISGEAARCLWGVDPRVASYLNLEVYDENGEEKAATTAVSYQDGRVNIRAYDFTFSTTTVSAQVVVKAGQRCFTAGVQMKNLKCTRKGKRLVWRPVR